MAMLHRGDRSAQLERLARLADGSRSEPEPTLPEEPPPPRSRLRRRLASLATRVAPFVSGVLVVLVALALYTALVPPAAPLTTDDIDRRVEAVLASQIPGPPYSALAFAVIAPSLVHVQSHTGSEQGPAGSG